MFVMDVHTPRVLQWVPQLARPLILSAWTITEFSSALALRRRMNALSAMDRLAAESAFDTWLSSNEIVQVDVGPRDFASARQLMRLDTVPLRAADALHLAIAMKLGIAMATLDDDLQTASRTVGLAVSSL